MWEIPSLLINISLWECYQCIMWYHHSCMIDWFNLLKWARGKLVKVSPSKNSGLCPSTLPPIFTYYKSVSFWSKDKFQQRKRRYCVQVLKKGVHLYAFFSYKTFKIPYLLQIKLSTIYFCMCIWDMQNQVKIHFLFMQSLAHWNIIRLIYVTF